MRPIDANRLKALLMVDFMQLELFGQKYKVSDALRTVDNTPTEDAVPVIRCRDCIHNVANRKTDPMDITDYSGQDIVCDYFMTDGQEPDDYCSKARTKENEK